MRCIYCRTQAGILRRTCPTCAKVVSVVGTVGGEVGFGGVVDILAAEGLTREQVDRVLDARIGERPTLRDKLTSEVANFLMRNLGMPGRQTPDDVLRVRLGTGSGQGEGTWMAGEKPPEGVQ